MRKKLIEFLFGKFYTEKEVKDVLSKMQCDMAANVFKANEHQKLIIPLEYWREHNGKYDTNLYEL